jgi:predicted nucleotidyltransferase
MGVHELQEKLSRHEQAALAELKERLTRDYEVQDIRLFGSKARGAAHSESDLDLFIVVPQLDWDTEKAIYTLCFDLSLKYGLLLAPTLYSRAELADPRLQATPFYRTIQTESVPV